MNSAAGAPAAATSTPAIAGPSMNVAEKAMFRVAFACRSAACVNASRSLPCAVSHSIFACSRAACAVSARNSALAASAAVPSSAASSRIAGSQKCHSSTARPHRHDALEQVQPAQHAAAPRGFDARRQRRRRERGQRLT